MASISACTLQKNLRIFPAKRTDYEHLARFHYLSAALGPTRAVYKLIDEHPWRQLATRLMAETMPLTGAAMVEAVSVMGRDHPFLERAGMRAFGRRPDAKTERMATALETVGIGKHPWNDSKTLQTKIERLDPPRRIFIDREMDHFCQKFTNRRGMSDSPERTDFVLSKLTASGAYYLWYAHPE
jgi:hypothetical protein